MEKKKATIHDIAKKASTSSATVSRVLSKKEYYVSPELKEKILKIAKELNYTPNLLGRNLKSNSSNDIGVIIPTLTNPYYTMLIKGIEEVASRNNFDLFLCNTNGDLIKEKKFVNSLYQKQVKGVIIASVSKDALYLEEFLKNNLKIVSMDQNIDLECDKVNFDFYSGGYLAGEHLINLGHKKIAFVSSKIDLRYSRKELFNGFKKALENYKIELKDEYIIQSEIKEEDSIFFEYENSKILTDKVLEIKDRPTAIFCTNDITALGVSHHLQSNNISIPEDISVVGFDNIPLSELSYPSLSTIDQNAYEMGQIACEILLKNFENNSSKFSEELLSPKLVIRNSTKKLK